MFSKIFLAVFVSFSLIADIDLRPPKDTTQAFMTQGQYLAGGVVGSIIGLGIGHAIEGRYLEKGWIFTLAEGVSVTMIGTGAALLPLELVTGLFSGRSSGASFYLLGLGGAALVGFKIWEIIDLWSTPSRQNMIIKDDTPSKGKVSILPVVAPTYLGLSLTY